MKGRVASCLLGAACLAAVGAALWPGGEAPEELPPRPVAFAIPDGAARAYRISWRSEARVSLSSAGGGAWTLDGEGRLFLGYFAAGSGWDVAARLDADLRLDGTPAEGLPGLDRPFSFHQDRQGYATDFAFAPGLPEDTRVLLRQTVSRLQVALSNRGAETWKTRERDGLGRFRAVYVWGPGLSLRKEKLEYLPGDTLVREVVESETELRLLAGAAGVAEVRGREVIRGREEGLGHGEESVSFEATLVEGERRFGSWAEFVAMRDRPFAPAPARGAVAVAPAGLREALVVFDVSFETDRAAAEGAVLAWLRAGAGAPDELVRWLDECSRGRVSLDPARQAVLFRLLAEAGTPAAVDALIRGASDNSFASRTRRLAIGHMGAVAAAEPRQVEALLRIASDSGADADLAGMALLAVGALGHRELSSGALASRVATELGARFEAAADSRERTRVLEAIGNTGNPALLPTVRVGLGDADPGVRAAAARALRRVEGDEVAPLLLRRYAEDRDPAVRAAVVETLGGRAPTEELLAWARGEALRARDEETRLALVDWLGANVAGSSENEAVLRRLLASNPGRRVERQVLRYVAPRPGS